MGFRDQFETARNRATDVIARFGASQKAAPAAGAAPVEPVAAAPASTGTTMRGAVATERPFSLADAKLFPNTPAAEAVVGEHLNPTAPRSNFQSPGYADHFAPPKAAESSLARRAGGTALGAVGKAGAVGAAGMGTFDAVSGAMEGDYKRAALGTADTAAAFGLTNLATAGPSAVYFAGRGAQAGGEAIYDRLGQGAKDAIGGTVNNLMRSVGLGYDGSPQDAEVAARNLTGVRPAAAIRDNPLDTRLAAGTASAPQEAVPAGTAVTGAPGVRKLAPGNYTNVAGDDTGATGPGVSTINTSEGMQRQSRANEIYREMAAIQAGQDQPDVLSNGAGMRVVGGSSLFRQEGAPGAKVPGSRAERAAAALENTRAIAEAGNTTSRANNADSNRTTMRGQDIGAETTTRGQDMTARTAANAARIEQMNKDRQFQFDVQKHGDTQAKVMFEQREAAQKNLHTEISGMLPPITGPDGKQAPDAATAARYATGLNAALSDFQKVLEQRAAAGDTKAGAALKNLQEKGVAGLDAKDKRRFVAGMQAREAAEANHTGGLNPIGGTAVISDAPVTSMRKTSDGLFGLGSEYTTNRGDTIPGRVVERDGSFFGGRRNTNMRDLIIK
jgi:hypothetical protein